jgi:hypothetical protein
VGLTQIESDIALALDFDGGRHRRPVDEMHVVTVGGTLKTA